MKNTHNPRSNTVRVVLDENLSLKKFRSTISKENDVYAISIQLVSAGENKQQTAKKKEKKKRKKRRYLQFSGRKHTSDFCPVAETTNMDTYIHIYIYIYIYIYVYICIYIYIAIEC